VPFPLPVAPEVMLNQLLLAVADQLQPALVVTLAVPDPEDAEGLADVGATVKVQAAVAPAWITVTVLPATVSVPVRGELEVFAATLNVTVPLPFPLAPEVIVNQEVLLVAAHVQPAVVETVELAELAAAAGLKVVGATVKLHVVDAPA